MSLPDERPRLHRNVWVTSLASFLTDVSSEMVTNLVALFLYGTLGVKTNVIGVIEGVAATTASLVDVGSGRLSDRWRSRKWLAVAGYALSTAVKPFFYVATTWGMVAGVRWLERVGKGIRGSPRDALIADSVAAHERGFAFGLHRAADTAGAVLGLVIAWLVLTRLSPDATTLDRSTFQTIVLVSLVPAVLAVVVLVLGARDVPGPRPVRAPPRVRGQDRRFRQFLVIVGIFELGNSSDAFVLLLASERGLSLQEILLMLISFNVAYAVISAPAGRLADRLGRNRVLLAGWLVYAIVYAGLALAQTGWQVWALVVVHGVHYGLTAGAAKTIVAELVPASTRAGAFGAYRATLGILDLPASLIAGVLWHGLGTWAGFGPSAPFAFGAGLAMLAAVSLARWSATAPAPAPAPDSRA